MNNSVLTFRGQQDKSRQEMLLQCQKQTQNLTLKCYQDESLSIISKQIKNLDQLNYLYMHINEQQEIAPYLSELADSLSFLKNLKHFLLNIKLIRKNEDEMTYFISQLGDSLLNLKNLNSFSYECKEGDFITSENIKALNHGLSNLQNLTLIKYFLSVSSVREKIDMVQDLINGIGNLTNIRSLKLAIQIKLNFSKFIRKFVFPFQKLINLEELELVVLTLGIIQYHQFDISYCLDDLPLLPHLKILKLSFKSVQKDFELNSIFNIILSIKSLEDLQLDLSLYIKQKLELIIGEQELNIPNLNIVVFNIRCQLSQYTQIVKFGKEFYKFNQFQKLHLVFHHLQLIELKEFGEFLQSCKQLEEFTLNMNQNTLDCEEIFAESLQSINNLRKLEFCASIDRPKVTNLLTLMKGLKNSYKLESFKINLYNKSSIFQNEECLESIKNLKNLKSLSFMMICFYDDLKFVGQALSYSPQLIHLELVIDFLEINNFENIESITSCFIHLQQLISLKLYFNQPYKQPKKSFLKNNSDQNIIGIQQIKGLKNLKIWQNIFSYESKDYFNEEIYKSMIQLHNLHTLEINIQQLKQNLINKIKKYLNRLVNL